MPPSPKDRLRGVARRARDAVVADVADVAPTGLDAVLASGLFDPWYYQLQTRVEREPLEALRHYLAEGASQGLLPNPLTDVDATGLDPLDVAAAVRDGSARLLPVRPLLDDVDLVTAFPAAAEHPGGPAGFYLGHAHAGSPVPPLGTRSWRRFVQLRRQQSGALQRILDAGVFDRAYYEAQVLRTFASDRAAVWHFLETGESAGVSPSPLYERSWYRSKAGVSMPMTFAHFLKSGQTQGAAGPHFDGATYVAGHPEAAGHRGGPLGHFLEHADDSTSTCPDPADGVVAVAWGVLREAVTRAAAEIGRQQHLVRPEPSRWARWHLETITPVTTDAEVVPVAILSDGRQWDDEVPAGLGSVLDQSWTAWTMHVVVDADRPLPRGLDSVAGDARFVVHPSAHVAWAARMDEVVGTVSAAWTTFWQPGHTWHPDLLRGLVSGAGAAGAHTAVVDTVDGAGELRGALPGHDGLLWQRPRSLAGFLLPTAALRVDGGAFRAAADDVYGWDFLLRHGQVPAYLPFVGVRGSDLGALPLRAGLSSTHEHVVRAERLVDWQAAEERLGERVPGRVSLLIPTFRDRRMTRDAIDHALAGADGDVEVVVVDNGSDREVTAVLVACFAADERVRIRRVPRNTNFATASNLALEESTGEVVVFLNNDTQAQPGWLAELCAALDGPGVLGAQPLLLYPDGAIQSAGTVFQGSRVLPAHLLASHPVGDLTADVDLTLFHAVTAACMAIRADLVVPARGFDPVYANGMEDVDLCLRLVESHGGRFVTARDARVVHLESRTPGRFARVEPNRLRFLERWGGRMPGVEALPWEQAGFEVGAFVAEPGLPVSGRRTAGRLTLRRPVSTVVDGPGAGLPRLRWAVKISAPGGPRGDLWGDAYFADDVVRGLRHWGQEVFVDRRGAHERPGVDHLDDVTLTLRGLRPAVAQPGATNVLWVISHPDDVTVDELDQGFDVVYAAGRSWAESMTTVAAQPVRVLLQATDGARFTPDGEAMPDLGTVFVGRTREVLRPIVRDAIDVGADLTIFGDGWGEFVDPSLVAADHLDNRLVPAAYRGARIVLNDHWDDMARRGFYSNRLFDAVASGARVVSDPVDGIDDVFGPSVRTYTSLDELSALLDPASTAWAGADQIAANAVRVGAEHSFVARAQVLLADVLDARGIAHDVNDR